MKILNIYDISKLAGVSIATVSRVLNGSPNVSAKTRQKVLDCMERSGYTPNAFARGLGLNSMKLIGILCADSSDLYLAKAVYHIEQFLRAKGYRSLLCCTGYETAGKQAGVDLLLQSRVDGIVMAGSHFVNPNDAENQYIRDCASQVPVMLLNADFDCPGVYCTLCDDLGSTQEATEFLLDYGIRDILYLYNSHSYSARKKQTGYQAAYLTHDLPVCKEYQRYFNGSREDIEGVSRFLDELSAKGLPFHGIVASEDFLAAGAVKYARKTGLSIPEDLAIVGFNNSILASCCEPELTSVDNHLELLCRQLTDTLLKTLTGETAPRSAIFPGELIFRGTTPINRRPM